MSRRINLTGRRFGRLVAIRFTERRNRCSYWLCRCDCGATKSFRGANLRLGITKSCGCLQREIAVQNGKATRKHGRHKTPEYNTWSGMWDRCNNPKAKRFEDYGARGIRVCDRWKSFQAFYDDMGPRLSPRHTMDRKDNNGDYAPDNCRWATPRQQARNRRSNHWLEYDGRRMAMVDWAEEKAIHVNVLSARLRKGWSVERTLTTPLRVVSKRSQA